MYAAYQSGQFSSLLPSLASCVPWACSARRSALARSLTEANVVVAGIKEFADDSGHTAQEFYTNRTLVQLMVQMLEPQPGERIYDPTVGTGGMLISALAEVKRRGGDTRRRRYPLQ